MQSQNDANFEQKLIKMNELQHQHKKDVQERYPDGPVVQIKNTEGAERPSLAQVQQRTIDSIRKANQDSPYLNTSNQLVLPGGGSRAQAPLVPAQDTQPGQQSTPAIKSSPYFMAETIDQRHERQVNSPYNPHSNIDQYRQQEKEMVQAQVKGAAAIPQGQQQPAQQGSQPMQNQSY